MGDGDDDDDVHFAVRSQVCSRLLAVWWCPKRIQKYRIPKYGLSEEAQAQKEPSSSSSSSNSSGDQSFSFYFYFSIFLFFIFPFIFRS